MGASGPTPGSVADLTPDADPEAVARAIVLRQLTMAARTRGQLSQALARRGVPEDVSERVLDRFTELGLVDDAAFAQQWVSSRQQGRGLAPRALAQELRRKGVEEDLVRDAVGRVSAEDELAAARALVRRRWVPGEDPQRRYRRLAGMLARRGYGGGVVVRAIREESALLGEGADPETDVGDPDVDGSVEVD